MALLPINSPWRAGARAFIATRQAAVSKSPNYPAKLPGHAIVVRASRCPSGPVLIFGRAEVAAFLKRVTTGEFDDFCRDADIASLPHALG